jgi:hypothetical protein
VNRPVKSVAFVEDQGFSDSWKKLGHDDDDLFALQDQIAAWPKSAPVIAGTGGVRKLRFASSRQRTGKRGGSRVCYVYFEHHRIVVLAVAFAKTVKSDLLAWERKALKRMVEVWDRQFAAKHS